MADEKKRKYTDFSNVENMKNYLIPEQMPEGPYGSPRNKYKPVSNKSTPWKEGQRYYSAFNYNDKDFHEDLPRQLDPTAHHTHDHPNDFTSERESNNKE